MSDPLPEQPPSLPHYGIPVADEKAAKPMLKLISARIMAKSLKGLTARPTVKIKHKKKKDQIKYY